MRRSALILGAWMLASCSVGEPRQGPPEAGPLEALLLDYDRGGKPREKALQALKALGDTAVAELEPEVLPKNSPDVRRRAIEILAKLQGYPEESAETKALVMATVGDWDFDGCPLQEACAALQAASEVSFRWSETVNPRTKVSIKVRSASLNLMLHLMLRPLRMTFIIQGKEVWITPNE